MPGPRSLLRPGGRWGECPGDGYIRGHGMGTPEGGAGIPEKGEGILEGRGRYTREQGWVCEGMCRGGVGKRTVRILPECFPVLKCR